MRDEPFLRLRPAQSAAVYLTRIREHISVAPHTKEVHAMPSSNPRDVLPAFLPEAGYLRQAQLIPGFLPFSRTTLWRMVRQGQFPKPIKLSARVTAWRAWMATKGGGDQK